MNDIVILILTWLPLIPESALLVFAIKFISKKIKEHESLPDKVLSEVKKANHENAILCKDNQEIKEMLVKALKDNEELKLRIKGVLPHGEIIRKN